jgi:hypothetical protein
MLKKYCVLFVALFSLLFHSYAQVSLFLLGDAGEPYISNLETGNVLRKEITSSKGRSVVIFLGDNIYPAGLPSPSAEYYQTASRILDTQISWVKGSGAQSIFIPGNHDWNHWGEDGLEYVLNQQKHIQSRHDSLIIMLPGNGCPGPVEVPLSDNSVLLILDTQWFIQEWGRPEKASSCESKTNEEVIRNLEQLCEKNKNRRIVIAAHHPLISYGVHGSVFSLKDHLFPLTAVKPYLYIPLPVIGSLYPLYRKLSPHIQDMHHPKEKEFISAIQNVLVKYAGAVYVSGHEHSLQYIKKNENHFVVSGAAVKTEHVKKKRYSKFASKKCGFAKLEILPSGAVKLTFIRVDKRFPEGQTLYHSILD